MAVQHRLLLNPIYGKFMRTTNLRLSGLILPPASHPTLNQTLPIYLSDRKIETTFLAMAMVTTSLPRGHKSITFRRKYQS